jgi:2-dehydro-3-deoxygalactonokinase
MGSPAFIAGDWGTTHLRLALCDTDGEVLRGASGPGVAQVQGDFEATLAALTEPWLREHGSLPTILCGMVGSTIGWQNVPYVACPSRPTQIASAMTRIADRDVFIAPGLTCRNRHESPDVMRGEETQILGALRLQPELSGGTRFLCLPGTHTKWAVLENGVVRDFVTSVTGELFAIIRQHSVLVRTDEVTDNGAAFDAAIDQVNRYQHASLSHLLFECRSRQLMSGLSPADAAHYLSGLLIADDVASALRMYRGTTTGPGITLIGAPSLTALYARVLAARSIEHAQIDGAQASLSGLTALHSLLQTRH